VRLEAIAADVPGRRRQSGAPGHVAQLIAQLIEITLSSPTLELFCSFAGRTFGDYLR